MQLATNVKVVRAMNSVAAGTTTQNSSVIDTAGYDGVMFITAFGALTATQVTSVKLQDGAAANLSDAADLAGSGSGNLADADSNIMVVHDLKNPQKRYCRVTIVRGTANAVIDSVIAILYKGRKPPELTDATVKKIVTLNSPDDGTA
jgi:hypothetical protein